MGIDDCGNPSTFHFLLYGDYGMNITNSTKNPLTGKENFLPYNENITSAIYGIYNTANPQSKYKNAGSEYAYPVVLQRNDTYVRGTIAAERKEQPLHGTHDDILKPYKNNLPSERYGKTTISSYVLLVNKNNTSEQYTCDLKDVKTLPNGNYIYDFNVCIKNRHAGEEFSLYLVSNYGGPDGKMTIKKWPATITADGCIYELETAEEDYVQVDLETDVNTFDFTIKCIEAGSNPQKPVAYTATIERCGLESWKYSADVTADKSGTAHNQGVANFKDVKKGFYTLTIDYLDSAYDYPDVVYTIFVGEGNYLIEAASAPELHSFVFECTPVTAGGTEITTGVATDVLMQSPRITFNVVFDNVTLTEGVHYTVSSLNGSNRVQIIVNDYYAAANSVKVEQSVQCFDPNDKFTYTGTLPESVTHRFQIHRLENNNKTGHNSKWEYENIGTEHENYCQRCTYGIWRANHYVDGSGQNLTTTTYFTKVYSSDNLDTHGTHIKHCAICNKFDDDEYCSPESSWTATYNKFKSDTAHPDHTDYKTTIERSTSSSSPNNHYKYCTSCGGRTNAAGHDWSTGCSHSYYSGEYEYKCIGDTQHQKQCSTCSYSGTAADHSFFTETIYYTDDNKTQTTTDVNAAKYERMVKYCTECGHIAEDNTKPIDPCGGVHSWSTRCDTAHKTPSTTTNYWPCTYMDDTAHCYTCGSTSCTCSVRTRYCITCSVCGVTKKVGINETDRWCHAHMGSPAINWPDGNEHYTPN